MFGLLIMTLSLLPVGLVTSINPLLLLIGFFYIGSIIAEPARETLGASLADARARGSYMGFSRLGLALGGAIGYTGGGWMYDTGRALDLPELPWFLLGIVGFITLTGLYWQFNLRRIEPAMLSGN
jgi:DHA1 family multidrug resistance protein-like MFS transporter